MIYVDVGEIRYEIFEDFGDDDFKYSVWFILNKATGKAASAGELTPKARTPEMAVVLFLGGQLDAARAVLWEANGANKV